MKKPTGKPEEDDYLVGAGRSQNKKLLPNNGGE